LRLGGVELIEQYLRVDRPASPRGFDSGSDEQRQARHNDPQPDPHSLRLPALPREEIALL